MAQELREGDGKAGIARAGKRKWGYDPAQVDAFQSGPTLCTTVRESDLPSVIFSRCRST